MQEWQLSRSGGEIARIRVQPEENIGERQDGRYRRLQCLPRVFRHQQQVRKKRRHRDDDEHRRSDALYTTTIELHEPKAAPMYPHYDVASDQKTGDDKEDVDADESTRKQ